MVAALDHVDGVDLHVAQVLDRVARCLGTVPERRWRIEALGVQPDVSGGGLGERDGLVRRLGHGQAFSSRKFLAPRNRLLPTVCGSVAWDRRGLNIPPAVASPAVPARSMQPATRAADVSASLAQREMHPCPGFCPYYQKFAHPVEITHFPERHFWHAGYDKARTDYVFLKTYSSLRIRNGPLMLESGDLVRKPKL